MKRVLFHLAAQMQPIILHICLLAAVVFLLSWQLGSLTPGLSQTEIDYAASTANLRDILDQPLQAPHAILQYVSQKLASPSASLLRAPSALFGLLSAVGVFLLLRLWHSERIALLGGLLYATSSWFLHTARVATPEIMFTLLPTILAVWVWLLSSRRRELSLVLVSLGVAALLYVPGMVWFVFMGAIWQARNITQASAQALTSVRLISAAGFILVLSPLLVASFKNPLIIRELAGWPEQLPGWGDLLSNLINIPAALFWSGPDNSSWLPGTPLLDIATIVLFVLGVYLYIKKLGLDRARLLISSVVLSIGLICLGVVPIALLLPFVYLCVAAGVVYLLSEWFGVFPLNPLARVLGMSLITVVVLLSIFYNLTHYFIAWPNSPQTQQTYSQQL